MSFFSLFSAFLQLDGETHMLFSCVLESPRTAEKPLLEDTEFLIEASAPLACKVKFFRAVIPDERLAVIVGEAQKSHQINLKYFCDEDSNLKISDYRKVLQLDSDSSQNQARFLFPAPESINYSTCPVEIFYTESQARLIKLMSDWDYEQTELFQEKILAELQRQTGLSFKTAYRFRLGCFEVYRSSHLQQFPYIQPTQSGFEIHPSTSGNDATHCIHVVLRDGEDIIFDRLLRLDPSNVVQVNINGPFNNIEITYFDKQGNLLHKEHRSDIDEGITINMQISSGGAKRIEDELTMYLERRNQPESPKAAEVDTGLISNPIVIQSDKSLVKQNKRALSRLFLKADSQLKGNFFKEKDEKGKAYSWLIDFINGSKSIWIIDPYLSSKTVIQAFRRINHEVEVRAITSIGKGEEQIQKELETALAECGKDIACALQVVNLTKNDKGKLFHDRFLLRFDKEKPEAYMLSNSLSTYGENFPFTVMQLDWRTTDKVIAYFNEILSESGTDNKRLWDSREFHKQIKGQINDNWLLNSSFFQFGLNFILGGKFDLTDLAAQVEFGTYDEGGFILRKQESVGFKTNLDIFQDQLRKNVLAANIDALSVDELASILLAFGELAARCHADELKQELAAWLMNLAEKDSLTRVLNRIIAFYDKNAPFEAQHSLDIIYPKNDSLTRLFEVAEWIVQAPLEIRGRYYGLQRSAELIVPLFPLQIELGGLNQEEIIIKNILQGIIEALGYSQTHCSGKVIGNLLQSKMPIFKVIACCHLNQIDCSLEKLANQLKLNGISDELTILTLARKYKSFMHRFYCIKDRAGADVESHLKNMSDISRKTCEIWEQSNVSERYLEAIYRSFFGKYKFALGFIEPLGNQREKQKFCQFLISQLEAEYGWLERSEEANGINDHEAEVLVWAAKAYQIAYPEKIFERVGEWDKTFVAFAKGRLEKPLYKGNTSNLCNRMAALYFFISEAVLCFLAHETIPCKLSVLVDGLITDTDSLFAYENCSMNHTSGLPGRITGNITKIRTLMGKMEQTEPIPD